MTEVKNLNLHNLYCADSGQFKLYVLQFDLSYVDDSDKLKHIPYLIATVFLDSRSTSLAMVDTVSEKLIVGEQKPVPKVLHDKLIDVCIRYEEDLHMRQESFK